MNHTYWNKLAADYTDNVLEIVDQDLSGIFVKTLKKHIKKNHVVADLGCGPGSLLPYLSEHAKKVYAVDFAQELLDLAQERFALDNVIYQQYDLTAPYPPKIKANVVCCINALIHPNDDIRQAMMCTLISCLKISGVGVMVVPSFESITHVYHTLYELQRFEGAPAAKTQQKLDKDFAQEVISPVKGVVNIGGEATKCYTREELITWLTRHQLHIVDIHKIEFSWQEELDNPPRRLQDPFPWDWLVVFKK